MGINAESKVLAFMSRLTQTWKPNNRIRVPFYTNNRQLTPKHPVLLGPQWSDIEIILRDCPWRFQNYRMKDHAERGEKWAKGHGRPYYDSMHTGTIAELPIEIIAAKNAILLDWVTFPKINEAIEATEFRRNKNGNPIWTYKACPFVWIKTTPKARDNFKEYIRRFVSYGELKVDADDIWDWICGGKPESDLPGLWHKGNGFYSMANVEVCLLYTKGSPTGFRVNKDVPQPIIAPVGDHSAKPREIYEKIDRLFGSSRKRAELFARKTNPPPPNWLATGLEYDGVDLCKALGMDRRFWYENQPKYGSVEMDSADGDP